MNPRDYSPRKVDLFFPARSANFFASGSPQTEAGLCAEMMRLAYSRSEPFFQFDRHQIRMVLQSLSFSCDFFESSGTPEDMGTHAFLAFHDNPEPGRKLIVVAFRGTDAGDPTDLANDAAFLQTKWDKGGLVHRGFAEALDQILAPLSAALDKVKGRTLFTGHSLGAAMATLLASIKPPDFLYTFGCPRVGNVEFVSSLNGVNNRRFVNCCDIVTRIPPEDLGTLKYIHYGVPYYIDRNGEVSENPIPDTINRDRLIAASDYLVEYAWISGNIPVRELADHAPINYVAAVAADLSQPKLPILTRAALGADS